MQASCRCPRLGSVCHRGTSSKTMYIAGLDIVGVEGIWRQSSIDEGMNT